MSNPYELPADVRGDVGKGASRRLRRLEDKVPAILYGGGEESQPLLLEHRIVRKALQQPGFSAHILTLKINGKAQKAVLKDVQRHPYKPIIMHMDFLRITGKEKLHMNVPLHFLNEDKAPGLANGGVVFHNMHHIEIVCSPADLPEAIEVDVANMELNDVIHLSEIKLPKGVESVALQHENDAPVVSVHIPRVIVEEEPVVEEAAAEGEAVEGAEGAEEAPAAEAKPAEE